MKQASPAQLRKAMVAAQTYVKAGILFVPVPVLDDADHAQLVAQAAQKLEQLIEACDD